jgi:lysophospholipase L1-like esterase
VISPTASPAAGPYRVYAQERLFGREYAGGYEGLRFLYRQTIARPHTVQWFNGATLLGTTYATDRVECVGTANTSTDRIESAGHGLLEGHRIHIFTTGEVPGGLGNHEQYFVRNPTTNAFQLSVSPTGTVIDLTTTGGTLQITGPYFIDITAPGGALNLSVRTLTDCSDLTTVFFLGTNDVGTAFASVMSNLNDMIGRLEHDRYIVVTPLNNESTRADATGADLTNYLGYQALLTSMRSTFGTRLVDIYQMFMDAYIPGTDSASENAAGLWPDRFRADTIHPNATGESMVRDAIIAKLTERGWWNTSA